MKIVSFITLLIGVTTAAAAAAESAASSSSEGNDKHGGRSVLHGFKNDVVQEQLNLHHHREQEDDESVRGALRGFKKEGAEQQKLFYPGHGGQVMPSGYHWWNPNGGGNNRDATGDYKMTRDALWKVATHSRMAAAAATETASAALASDPSALMTALGDLVGNTDEAETFACLAESLVGTKSEDKLDGEDSSTNLLKDMEAIPGMAGTINKLATKAAEFAERAIVAIDNTYRNVREVETATTATKASAQATKNVVTQLRLLMISNTSGPGQDALIDTAP